MVGGYVDTIAKVKAKISAGSHTAEDIKELNSAYEDYFMLQKEIAL
jgi:hypothetical protein